MDTWVIMVQAHTPKNSRWSGLTLARDFSRVFIVHMARLTTIRKVMSSFPGFSFDVARLLQAIWKKSQFHIPKWVFTLEDEFCTLIRIVWAVLWNRARKSAARQMTQVGPCVRMLPTAPKRVWRYTPAWAAPRRVESKCGGLAYLYFKARIFIIPPNAASVPGQTSCWKNL